MARSGSNKRRSVDQEEHIANVYGGKRSPSSGAAVTDSGDVVTPDCLYECKTSGAAGENPIPEPKFIKELGKVVEEARERGRTGALCLRYYLPDSYLANKKGLVEVTVRLTNDDAEIVADSLRYVDGD